MAHRFLLWVVAGALTVWISLAMVVAPAVAFGAPDSGSDTTGAASDPAAPAKPTKQHKPAKAHTEKKAVGAHKDKVEDQPSEPKADPTDADPRAGDGTGAHTEPGGQGPSTSVATADEDAVDGAKEAAAQDVPVTIAPDPDPSVSAGTAASEPVAKTGAGHSTEGADNRANGSGTSSTHGVEAGTVEVKPRAADGVRAAHAGRGRTDDRRGRLSRRHPVGPDQGRRRKVLGPKSCHLHGRGTPCRDRAAQADTAQRDRDARLQRVGLRHEDHRGPAVSACRQHGHGGPVQAADRLRRRVFRGRGLVLPHRRRATGRADLLPARIHGEGRVLQRHGGGVGGRTHSIVVAPTISSNLFACDSCQLGGDPMHYAVAKLFSGDRAALTASASAAAGYDVVLPQRYVIAGHSEGGQLAAGAAGYAAQIAAVNGTPLGLAGVLLLDTSEVGGAVSRGIAKIPGDIPALYMTEEPSVLNDFGSVDAVLEAARPGQFNGVRLVGGTHSDAIQTTNPFVTIGFNLLTGVPRPENVAAVQLLADGWIRDMFAGTVYDRDARTGIYGDLGSRIEIPTDKGTASAYVLPAPPHKFTLIDLISRALIESTDALRFGYCAVDPDVEFQQGGDAARPAGQRACSA